MNRRKNTITLGDKIFARVTRNGQTIYNFVSEKIADMTQLISELRFAMKDIHGLVMIHIRNYHQGWGEERPLMLYAEKIRNYPTPRKEAMTMTSSENRKMDFPWETH